MRGIIIAIVLWLGAVGISSAQVTCQKVGQQTYCTNGQVLQRFGNTTYDGKGHAWEEQSGNRTTGSNGTVYQQSRNQITDNKGAVLQQFGNQTVRSNGAVYLDSGNGANVSQQLANQKRWGTGSSCYPVGDQIFCDPAPAAAKTQTAGGPNPGSPGTSTQPPTGPEPSAEPPGPLNPAVEERQFGP
jgi:hypothetical protein